MIRNKFKCKRFFYKYYAIFYSLYITENFCVIVRFSMQITHNISIAEILDSQKLRELQ